MLQVSDSTLCAQEVQKNTGSRWQTLKTDLTSPLTTDAVYILATGMLATTVIGNDDRNLDNQGKVSSQYDPPLKEYGYIGETVGWGYLNAIYILVMGGVGFYGSNKLAKERSEIMFSSSTFTLLSTTVLKLFVQRYRPNYPQETDSFPSGHASMAFNFASVIAAEHGVWYGVPAMALASFIAVSRVSDGRHWVTDVMAGATIGASYGWGVYWNRRKKKNKFWLSLASGNGGRTPGLQLSYSY